MLLDLRLLEILFLECLLVEPPLDLCLLEIYSRLPLH
jgi:hypothetical protein